MIRTLFARQASLALVLLLLFAVLPAAAQTGAESADGLWRWSEEAAIQRSSEPRRIVPQRYRTAALDLQSLSVLLADAPHEDQVQVESSARELSLPRPDGSFERFRIVESPIMEAALAAKYPEIRTYLGQGIDDPSASLRFDLSKQGFRAQVIGWRGSYYIDPYQPRDTGNYVVYAKADAPDDGEVLRCGVTGEALPKDLPNFQRKGSQPKLGSGTVRRTYRLAMAATGEYTAFNGGTVADGLAAIVTTMNRVNGIYERELSVRMVLVANNDLIVYTDGATDPYTNNSGSTMLGQNVTTLNTVIGAANFDIGHVVSTGGGGIAGLGVVCGSGKARGVTGSGSPVGDPFDVDYVAHEIGHQFRGNHTFNGSGGSCSGGNRNGTTAYEPGSGITIQAYAGICGADNLQPNSEDYFHRVSLNEMLAFTTNASTGASCGTTNATGNTPPVVNAPAAFTIPARTPFELTAGGSDANGDSLTWLWEQFDLGAANTAGSITDTGSGPLFRSFAPTPSPSRVFPSWRYILNNANVAPATAPLPGTSSPSYLTAEVLPSTNRTLNFRVTARDNRAGGGGTNEASTAVTVVAAAGPFALTAPNTAVSWAAGSTQTVTWDVAGTTANGINAANVRITLSLDGGASWPIELAASTPNDGSESVSIPANTPASTQARLRVQAVGNIFFDVSDANFSITGANTPPGVNVTAALSTRQGSPTATANVATVSDTQDAAGSLALAVSGAPPGLAASVQNNAGTVALSATASCELVAPGGNRAYPLQLSVTDSAGASTVAQVVVNVSRNLTPTLGTYANQALARNASTTVLPSAAPADGNGNLLGVSVSPTTLAGGGSLSVAANGQVTINVGASTPFATYPIEVEVADSCGAVERRRFDLVVDGVPPEVLLVQSGGSTAVTEAGGSDSYTVALSQAPTANVSVTATPDGQLQLSPSTLQFTTTNWATPQTITVSAVNDSVVEGPHSGVITHAVSGGGYSGVSVPPITVSITDNDSATLSTAPALVAEGDSGTSPLTFTLQLSGQVAGGFSVAYSTRADTATAGEDFVAASGSVSFDASVNPSRTVTVQVIGDTVAEADERFFLDLSSSQGGLVLSPVSAIGEIVNDDFIADLALRLSRLPGVVAAGQPISYVVDVENRSSVLAVPQANLAFTPAAQLQGPAWTCTASPGSSCSSASGSGALPTLALAVGGSARVQLNATVLAGTPLGTRFVSSAVVSLAAPYTDPEAGNNTDSLQSEVGIDDVFADGFE